MATRSKPNTKIWKFLPLFFGYGTPPKSLHFVFFYFQIHFSKEKKIPVKRKERV
jgi:hypothetical protein